jgi:hypothetical protein
MRDFFPKSAKTGASPAPDAGQDRKLISVVGHLAATGVLETAQSSEEWRPIAGYEGLYEVSNRGRVRRAGRRRCLKLDRHWRGYLRAQLYGAGGRRRFHRVHLLVAAAFIGPRPAGQTVDHLDEDKRNNAVTNLEYVTRIENHRRYLERRRAPRLPSGLTGRQALQRVMQMFAVPVRTALAKAAA